MRLHLIALPHTRVSSEFNGCAYTAKTLKFTKMMRAHEVILYAPEGSTSEHTAETVECLLDEDRQEIFGADDPGRLPGWPTFEQAAMFNSRAAEELGKRVRRGDLVLLTGGATHLPIMEQVEALYCEPGVGYEGIATGLCAFESHAWRHYVYAKRAIADGRWFDTVIPNYFDLSEFPVPASGSRDYLVYLGRIVPRKGPHIAAEIAQHAGLPLLVAGAGDVESGDGWLVANKGTPDEVRLEGAVTYLGPVTVEERADSARRCPGACSRRRSTSSRSAASPSRRCSAARPRSPPIGGPSPRRSSRPSRATASRRSRRASRPCGKRSG